MTSVLQLARTPTSPRHTHPPRLSPKESLIVELLVRDSELYGLQLVAASRGRLKRGTVYVTLGRMEDKGFITSRESTRCRRLRLGLQSAMLQAMSPTQGLVERIRLATYLAPSTLALSVPLGLAVATAWVLQGAARSRKIAGVALVGAAVVSVLMFANTRWLAPDANQGFRERIMTQYGANGPAPLRGSDELRFGELRNTPWRSGSCGRA